MILRKHLGLLLLIVPTVFSCDRHDGPLTSDAEASPARATGSSHWKTLRVPLIPQKTVEWCWAACAEMVTTYLNAQDPTHPPIIDQKASVICSWNTNPAHIPPDPDTLPMPPLHPRNRNWPTWCDYYGLRDEPFHGVAAYSFEMPPLASSGSPAPLSWDQITAQIDASKPIVFEENLGADASQNHYMVISGYDTFDDSTLLVLDPWPVKRPNGGNGGTHRRAKYRKYLGGGRTHLTLMETMYNISPNPAGTF